jgi:hypothetical protein
LRLLSFYQCHEIETGHQLPLAVIYDDEKFVGGKSFLLARQNVLSHYHFAFNLRQDSAPYHSPGIITDLFFKKPEHLSARYMATALRDQPGL